jgi:hypothetical protein
MTTEDKEFLKCFKPVPRTAKQQAEFEKAMPKKKEIEDEGRAPT